MKRTTVAVLIVLATLAAAGCGDGTPNALYSWGGWGSGTTRDPVGQRLAMTGIPLCTRGHTPITITSIEPVTVTGDLHVDQFRVSRGAQDQLAIYSGVPPGSRPATGFIIPAPTKPCNLPGTGTPRYAAVVVAHRTGTHYGGVSGLRVNYRVGNTHGVYTIDVTFSLCAKGSTQGAC